MEEVVCIGAGGHAGMLVDLINESNKYQLVGFLEETSNRRTTEVHGYPILGDDSMISSLKEKGVGYFIIGVGAVQNCKLRKTLYDNCIQEGLKPISLIHRYSILDKTVEIGRGTVILPGVIVNRNVCLGNNVILNTGVIVEHDSRIGDHSHIASGACITGDVIIKTGVLVGANSVVRQGVVVNSGATIGAGTVVLNNITSSSVYVGNPARKLMYEDKSKRA